MLRIITFSLLLQYRERTCMIIRPLLQFVIREDHPNGSATDYIDLRFVRHGLQSRNKLREGDEFNIILRQNAWGIPFWP